MLISQLEDMSSRGSLIQIEGEWCVVLPHSWYPDNLSCRKELDAFYDNGTDTDIDAPDEVYLKGSVETSSGEYEDFVLYCDGTAHYR